MSLSSLLLHYLAPGSGASSATYSTTPSHPSVNPAMSLSLLSLLLSLLLLHHLAPGSGASSATYSTTPSHPSVNPVMSLSLLSLLLSLSSSLLLHHLAPGSGAPMMEIDTEFHKEPRNFVRQRQGILDVPQVGGVYTSVRSIFSFVFKCGQRINLRIILLLGWYCCKIV